MSAVAPVVAQATFGDTEHGDAGLSEARSRTTQAEQIIALLRSRSNRTANNVELNEISFRYSARIHTLRQAGWHITTIRTGPKTFDFRLDEDRPRKAATC